MGVRGTLAHLGEKQDQLSVYVCGVSMTAQQSALASTLHPRYNSPQHSMAVYTGVLEVDSSFSLSVHDDLQLRFVRIRSVRRECSKKAHTLSYHRFVHVPTCTPCCRSYVPHKKFPQSSDKSLALESSRHTMNKAESTTARHSALFLFDLRMLFRRSDQIFRFSVVSRPMAF